MGIFFEIPDTPFSLVKFFKSPPSNKCVSHDDQLMVAYLEMHFRSHNICIEMKAVNTLEDNKVHYYNL